MADEYTQKLLEYIFATQVLILSNQLKTAKTAQGGEPGKETITEAIQLIHSQLDFVFSKMSILE